MRSALRRPGVLVVAIVAISAAGCFKSPDKSKLSCTTSAHCPGGYTCVVLQPGLPGTCQRTVDGGGFDAFTSVDSTTAMETPVAVETQSLVDLPMDGHASEDTWAGGEVVRTNDAESSDISGSGWMDSGSDSSADVPSLLPPDAATDYQPETINDSPADTADAARPIPDAAADLPPDTTPPAPDLAPDLPSLKPQGTSCSLTSECAAGLYCTDGVCCTTQSSCGTCRACNLAGSPGTCSAVAQGIADPNCQAQALAANCTAGVCNGSGACQPLASGTPCGAVCTNDQTNGVVAGQWYTTSVLRNKKCNGITAGPSGCVTDNVSAPTGCSAGLTCASSTTCKAQCYATSDCSRDYYCKAGTCTLKGGTCSDATECSNGACTGTFVSPTPHCEVCLISGYSCPLTTPSCALAVSVPGCSACNSAAQTCNADGSVFCPTEACPANAPDCGADSHCHCGNGGAQCLYAGQICVSGQCKMGGAWPCVNPTDCAYGTCNGGACPQTPSLGLCTQLKDGECANGTCSSIFKCP